VASRRAIAKDEPDGERLHTRLVSRSGPAKPGDPLGWRLFFNGKFYLMGGRSSDLAGSDFTHPFEYDPFPSTWTVKSATYPDNQVNNMACGVLNDAGTDYIYCVGGSAAGATTATDRVFRYDPVTDTINIIPAPWPGDADRITLPGGFTVFENKLYILGGFQINTAMTDKIYEFTPGTNSWVLKTATLPVPRGYIPTVAYATFIYTFGGSLWNGTTLEDTNDSFRYDPAVDSITSITNIRRATAETQALTFDEGGLAHKYGSWAVAGRHLIPLMKWTSTFRVPTRGQQARHSPLGGVTSRPTRPMKGGSMWQAATITPLSR